MKRLRCLSILAVFFLFNLAANAQSPWYAYFYNSNDGTLSHVTADGTVQNFSLGLGENPTISQYDLSFAHTRPELAYCTVATPSGQLPSQNPSTLVIRDIPNQLNRLEIDLGLSNYCRAGKYNANDSFLAVGLQRHSGDTELPDPQWEILLIDPLSGTIVDSVNSNNPASALVISWEGGTATDFIIPEVFAIEGEQLLFEAGSSEGRGLAYSFNLSSREFSPYSHYGLSYDRFANEEIWAARLEEYPMATDFGYYGTHNALMYVDNSGIEKIIYYTADWSVDQARFINAGQQIALQLSNVVLPQDPNLPAETSTKWIVIDREGNESDLLTNSSYSDGTAYHSLSVRSAYTGYSILETISNSNTNERTYRLSLVENGTQTPLWEQIANTDSDWSLVYMPEMPYQEFPPFPEFDLSSISTGQ